MKRQIIVRVPATSANLGPGFDCLGLALDLWNEFEWQETGDRNQESGDGSEESGTASSSVVRHPSSESFISTIGEGAGALPTDGRHLVAQTLADEYTRLTGNTRPAFRLTCRYAVPAGSGLGSSSTAVLGGLLLAHALAGEPTDGFFDPHGSVLARAIEMEGHGDNVAPALLGGLIIVSAQPGSGAGTPMFTITRRVSTPALRVVVCVPDFHFLTMAARSVVPTTLSRADAIFNVGRALLVIEALRSGDYELLGRSMDDRIHEPFRIPVVPGAQAARSAALNAGASAVALSGAGPGLIAFAETHHSAIGQSMVQAFAAHGLRSRYWVLDAPATGATIECA